ncbi:hypothetical protein NRIC_09990 [Enterococcus florum]|uniref:WxL domain-containing protein n=1 Tax=Enterococcus florum TaxID=2480627 RepID=A0A4P5PAU8_9ENTE|nr:WxL domain-containing protein [Enterococcus florum]GCF93108.1 hypothetical protein NRIC_09990 [Enterococcus florum]
MKKWTSLITLTASAAAAMMAASPALAAGTGDNNISSNTKAGEGYVATMAENEGKSTVQFTITPGDLTLDRVPDLNFSQHDSKGKNVSVNALASNGVVLDLVDNTVDTSSVTSKNKTAFDGNNDGGLQVTDYRFNQTGWNVHASLSDFTKDGGDADGVEGTRKLDGIRLLLKLAAPDNTNEEGANISTIEDGTAIVAGGGAVPVLRTQDGKTANGTTKTTTASGTTLEIAKQADVQPGTYQADMTWTLSNTATQKPAGTQ